ncbi:MAG: sensory transduction histidine kinase [Candidatus Methanoperedens nitroreducens]|uniref:histidine kinase n=1 Tax=Candidatus Methanoperedens nitratireducens TaxID=1392998 RepID=A0A0P8DYH6_9EURY|nr:PAS domain-containing sensor histidine kinase [Candidatus Methanoperedens sp. BLZ2]KAB2945127.1 MAG: PAS domain-containing sensor histidine kinase [Candidatus Methanoperedens sp.]KPQ42852.1 MAG: sensory transduction histidine kinase [Candidatus Methanoperedens sp. BLZ1]MBZ0176973.1 PAS domain-containing sensor histidine kinase [Candidatus Methanoperedens nitroreducens]
MSELKTKYKFFIISVLLSVASFLTYYFHAVLKTGIIFTHFFYIPIILAALWWKRKGMVVAIFLVEVLFLSDILIKKEAPSYDNIIRSIMFIVISSVVIILSERIAKDEKLLRDNEEEYRMLYEGSSDAVMMLDEDGFFDCNDATLRIFGFSKKEEFTKIHPKDVSPLYQPDGAYSLESANNKIAEAFRKGSNRFEWVHQRKNGDEFQADVLLTALQFRNKRVLQATIRDITQSKEVIDNLTTSNEFSKTIFNSMKDAFCIIDVNNFRIVEANDVFINEFGLKKEDIIGRTCFEITHHAKEPCNSPEGGCSLMETRSTGMVSSAEHIHYGKNGEKIYLEISTSPIKDMNGTVIQVIHISRDITRNKHAEDKLRESEEKFRLTVQSANDAIILTDSENNIISLNKSAIIMFGYDENEMVGKSFLNLLPKRYKETYRYGLEWMLSGVSISEKSIEMHGLRKNGTEFALDISVASWKTTSGTYQASIIRDITDRKRLEEEIIRINLELKMADQIKTQFLSIVSHELRTPITPMKAQLQMNLAGYFGIVTEKQKTSLEMILRNTERLDRLIGDVLDISKLEAGVMKFDKDRANLNEVVRNAIETMRQKAEDKNIELNLKEEKVENIIMDTDRITQVVINLVNNAIKFTRPGGIINVDILKSDKDAIVKIKDTGIGIKKEDQEKLFKPFVQVDSTDTRKFEGTGLGLSICKGIINSHGGKIWIESELSKGSTFQFTIPLKYEKN